jgi:hypothetical protein
MIEYVAKQMGREKEQTHESCDPVLSGEVELPGGDDLLLDRRRLLEELVMVATGRLGAVGVVNSLLGVSVVVRKVVWRAERAVARGRSSIVIQDAPNVAASAWTKTVRARHLHQLRNARVRKRKR